MSLLEIEDRESGIVLEGLQVLMAEEVLDVPQVRAPANELCGTGASKRIRGELSGQVKVPGKFHQLAANRVIAQPRSLAVEPQRRFAGLAENIVRPEPCPATIYAQQFGRKLRRQRGASRKIATTSIRSFLRAQKNR